METDLPDRAARWCQPLSADGLAIDVSSCQPIYTTGSATGGFEVSVGGDGRAFSTLGPAMLGVALLGRGLPCGTADGFCFYRTGDAPCRAVITRAGHAGDTAEAEIREPCVFTDGVNPTARVTVNRLRIRGVLRLRYEINRPSHDDGGVQLATECGVP